MANAPYGLFCPLAMAAEVLEKRWTILILGEMWCGASRFNDLRRSVPGISPTLLTKRLRELEENGLVERVEDPSKGTIDYIRTPKAIELEPALQMLSDWAYRHVEKEVALKDLNADYLLWNIYQYSRYVRFSKSARGYPLSPHGCAGRKGDKLVYCKTGRYQGNLHDRPKVRCRSLH